MVDKIVNVNEKFIKDQLDDPGLGMEGALDMCKILDTTNPDNVCEI